MKNLKTFLISTFFLLLFTHLHAQRRDSISTPLRDPIGDLNAETIKAGKFPGALMLPSKNISLAIGGFIQATGFVDSHYRVKNELLLPGNLTDQNTEDGQFFLGAQSSRLYFDGRTDYDNIDVEAYIEMDFRGGLTMRHIYLKLQNKKGQSLIMGQTWSNVMDLAYIPPAIIEPPLGGTPLSRQAQIRFTTFLGEYWALATSIEDPNNSDVIGNGYQALNKLPDVTARVSFDPTKRLHFSVSTLFRSVQQSSDIDNSKLKQPGFVSQVGMNVKIGKANLFTIVGGYGDGAERYATGTDRVNGYAQNQEMQLHKSYGGFTAYRHQWNKKLRSLAFLCVWNVDNLPDAPYNSFKTSTSVLFNTIYHLNDYVNFGIEYSYINQDRYVKDFNQNHRIMFGIQVF